MQRTEARALQVGRAATVHADRRLIHCHVVRGNSEIESRRRQSTAAIVVRLVGRVQWIAVGKRGGGGTVLHHSHAAHSRGVQPPSAKVLRAHRGMVVPGMVGGGRGIRVVGGRGLLQLLRDHAVVVAGRVSRASRGEVDGFLGLVGVLLRSLHPLSPFEIAVLEHLFARLIQGPVVALAVTPFLGHLDEALVEREVVADGVLPAFLVLGVVGELVHDELVDPAQGELLVGGLGDRHGNERHVRVGRLDVLAAVVLRVDGGKEGPVLLLGRRARAVDLLRTACWRARIIHDMHKAKK